MPADSCIGFDGRLTAIAGEFVGRDRLEARPEVARRLRERGLLEREEAIESAVGFSERSGTVIEPLPSTQWFVRLSALAPELLKKLTGKNALKLRPRAYMRLLRNWLANAED